MGKKIIKSGAGVSWESQKDDLNCNFDELYGDVASLLFCKQFKASHPIFVNDFTHKILHRFSTNTYYAIVPKKTAGYLLIILKNNVTTTGESLAATTSDTTSWRVTSVVNCVDAIVGYITAASSVGTWNNVNLSTGIEESFDSGTEYVYKQNNTDAGSYSMDIVVPSDGKFNVGFILSSGSCADVTIDVDGVAIDSNFTLVNSVGVLSFKEYVTTPGAHTVTVTKNISSGYCNLCGCNVSHLRDAVRGRSSDQYGYYRHDVNYNNYLVSPSANDYAIYDLDAGLWGGSYHGGENSISSAFLVDNQPVTLSTGESVVGTSISIQQSMTVDWSAHGGATLEINETHSFLNSGYALQITFDGTVRAESFFTTLYGVSTDFDQITFPKKFNITDLADGETYVMKNGNKVEYTSALTNQKISISHTAFIDEKARGGPYVWRASLNYHKYYYAYVDNGDEEVTDHNAINIFEFY